MTHEPRLDAYASAIAGMDLEDLAGIGEAQRYANIGPRIPRGSLDLLAESRRKRVHDVPLVEAGLIGRSGRATPEGESIIAPWHIRRALVRIDARSPAGDSTFEAWIGDRRGLIAAGPPPGFRAGDAPSTSRPDEVALDLVGPALVPLRVANWVGLAPPWTFDIDETVPSAVFDARRLDPATPPPSGVGAKLAEVWRQPWVSWVMRVEPGGQAVAVLSAGVRGLIRTSREPNGVRLQSMAPASAWRAVVGLIGSALNR